MRAIGFVWFVLLRTHPAESLLSLDLHVLLKPLHLGLLKSSILFNCCCSGPPFGVERQSVKHLDVFALIVGGQNEAAQGFMLSEVRTVPDMRAPVLVFGVKDEFHRPPFRHDDVIPYANTESRQVHNLPPARNARDDLGPGQGTKLLQLAIVMALIPSPLIPSPVPPKTSRANAGFG